MLKTVTQKVTQIVYLQGLDDVLLVDRCCSQQSIIRPGVVDAVASIFLCQLCAEAAALARNHLLGHRKKTNSCAAKVVQWSNLVKWTYCASRDLETALTHEERRAYRK